MIVSIDGEILVFPAYAGMIPSSKFALAESPGVPRIRGDDPRWKRVTMPRDVCSPHTRG